MFVLDNTVLSNFAAVEKIDSLVRILPEEAIAKK